jgi:hypothetical protein
MDLGEMQEEAGRLLGDPAHDRWPLNVLTSRLNEGQTITQGYTNATKTLETLTPVAGTPTVSLDAATMDILGVNVTRSDGNKYPLNGKSREALDFDYPNWQNLDDGQPIFWWYDATNQQVNLVPAPDSENAITNGLEVYEVRKPVDLVNASDIPFDSNNQMVPYSLAPVYWCVAQCWMDDGTPEALAKSRFYKSGVLDKNGAGQFEQQIMRILAKFDRPESVPENIRWRPQGGRAGAANIPNKGNPLAGL